MVKNEKNKQAPIKIAPYPKSQIAHFLCGNSLAISANEIATGPRA